jgi:hypothetical protein
MGLGLGWFNDMIRSRGPLAGILLAIIVASCGGRPSVTVRVAGEIVPTQIGSSLDGTPCSTTVRDAPFLPPVTIVREPTPLEIRVDADPGYEISGWIYEMDASAPVPRLLPASGPLEEFTLVSGEAYRSRSIVAARTYAVMVNVERSALGFRSEVSHLFGVRVEQP